MEPEHNRDSSSMEALFRRDHYTPEELSQLLGVRTYNVRNAARRGVLTAFLVDHRIVDIRREDVIHWLADREGR